MHTTELRLLSEEDRFMKSMGNILWAAIIALALFFVSVVASAADVYRDIWTPYDGVTGIACAEYNRMGSLEWKTRGGDYGPALVTKTEKPVVGQVFTFDATPLLSADGIVIRGPGSRIVNFHSREAVDQRTHPRLVVTKDDGSTVTVTPIADANISCSGGNGIGTRTVIKAGAGENAFVFFPKVEHAVSAKLELTVQYLYSGSVVNYALHPAIIPRPPEQPVQYGLASNYSNDEGIANDPAVLWASGVEPGQPAAGKCPVSADAATFGYVPALGTALQNRMGTEGTWNHCSLGRIGFPEDKEHREVFVRLEMRFGNNYRDLIGDNGGKLPLGLNSQYELYPDTYCGNAGESCATGDRGWSARGGYLVATDRNNPIYPRVSGNQYIYHYKQEGLYGDHVSWGPLALFELERWYTVEMQITVNDPGVANGILRFWVDGRLSREITNFQFRGPTTLHEITLKGGQQLVREAWLTWFHGGKNPPNHVMHGWYDNIVVATKYIGPRRELVRFDGPMYCEPGKRPICQ